MPALVRGSRGEPVSWARVMRTVAVGAVIIVAVRAIVFVARIPDPGSSIGLDYRLYTHAAEQWWATGSFYAPYQLDGPYEVMGRGEILYPPILLLLLLPFTILPAILWWVVPLGLSVWAISRMRPAAWSVAIAATVATTDAVQAPWLWGTPVIWLVPAVAWALLCGWPAMAIMVKPTLAPFLLAGLTRPRALFVGTVGFAVLALPFSTMWLDWLTVIRNSNLTIAYAYTQNVLLIVPVIAWLGREGRSPRMAFLSSRGLAFARPARSASDLSGLRADW